MVMVAEHCACVSRTVHFNMAEMANLVLCVFYHNKTKQTAVASVNYLVSVPLTWCSSLGTPTCGLCDRCSRGRKDNMDWIFSPGHWAPTEEPSQTAAPTELLYVWDTVKKSLLVSFKHLPLSLRQLEKFYSFDRS